MAAWTVVGHVSIFEIGDNEGFRLYRLTLGGGEVDDVAVRLEHVDLLNGRDGLDVHLLEGGLELLVVTTTGSVDLLDLSSGSTLSAIFHIPSVSARAFEDLARIRGLPCGMG